MQANVVKIAKTDYCGFGQVLPVILPHPSISRHRERPSALSEQWAIIFQNQVKCQNQVSLQAPFQSVQRRNILLQKQLQEGLPDLQELPSGKKE